MHLRGRIRGPRPAAQGGLIRAAARFLGRRALPLALLLLGGGGPARAQSPAADWRTLSTPHFRLHYPAPAEPWARDAATRLEAIRERVAAEVGFAPPETVEVLIADPVAAANGEAIPTLGWPRLILWTTPPLADSELGHYSGWADLLITHEETHLAHLLRPSRNRLWRALGTALPVGPIPLAAPRWAIEGYATLVEGRLTGQGRPNSDLRAAILRRWAQAGRLPSYAQLAADGQSWHGMSMAYLAGSAYLEWLEGRSGAGSLRHLWSRLTAKQIRSFDAAFTGVFGQAPASLYDRFRAELTWRAMEAERLRRAPDGSLRPQGELWQDLTWTTGAPAVSPDGTQIALVVKAKGKPGRLVLESAAPDPKAAEAWKKEAETIQARDPEDVPAVRHSPFPLKELHSWTAPDGIDPAAPRFLPDGRSILFVRFEPDGEGFLHPDLSLWSPESGTLRRITRGADVRDPDPAPDGRWAVATRLRYGLSQLVRVDLASGKVEPLTEATIEVVVDRPRISPDGGRIAFAAHRTGHWRIETLDLASGVRAAVSPEGKEAASPAWSPDGKALYSVLGQGGFLDVFRFPAAPGPTAAQQLTWMPGAALAPVPTPDGKGLFFLALEPDGLDLRHLDLGGLPPIPEAGGGGTDAATAPQPGLPDLSPALPAPLGPTPASYAAAEIAPSHPYGLGRQELFPLLALGGSPSGGSWEAGLRSGDVVGRFDLVALGAVSTGGGASGGALAGAFRALPAELRFHLFTARERPNADGSRPLARDEGGTARRGIEIGAAWAHIVPAGRFELGAALLWNRVERSAADGATETPKSLDQRLLALNGSAQRSRRIGGLGPLHEAWLDGFLGLHAEIGETGDASWERYGATLRGALRSKEGRLTLTLRRDDSHDLGEALDLYRLGGPAPSILPATLLVQRRTMPGLPLDLLTGRRAEEQRLELDLPALPAPLFYVRYRYAGGIVGPGGLGAPGGLDDWLALAGMEFTLHFEPQPIVRLPAFTLRAGVANVRSAPEALRRLQGDWRWWITTSWRP